MLRNSDRQQRGISAAGGRFAAGTLANNIANLHAWATDAPSLKPGVKMPALAQLDGLNPPKGAYVDDITYSSADGPSIYTHPLCPNTWRNNKKLGEEPPAQGY